MKPQHRDLRQSESQEPPSCHIRLFDQYLEVVPIRYGKAVQVCLLFMHTEYQNFLKIHGPLLFDLTSVEGLTQQKKEQVLQRAHVLLCLTMLLFRLILLKRRAGRLQRFLQRSRNSHGTFRGL
ncbi:hypothetical protein BDV26DRAFT_162114 [Aspergillus bertholletiae]|uniref:Uncharacterized protein n=1 Tax=Aspergillus bertholletiae TaxID=1226010 RepID=A0A5N7BN84_9EURO|nr:hypothetical protein BDV26DRAFT_162114 [Aspergillus bertholletiae]